MQFRIADTFTDSLARLSGEEQKLVKTTAFDLQLNPASPGMQFHKLDKARDKRFWSVRVGADLRLIVHRSDDSLLLCYVDHHDNAYHWAERRKLETHPRTGAAQLVEIRETVKEIVVPAYVKAEEPTIPEAPLFAHVAAEALLGYGVPAEWLEDVQNADEDSLLTLTDHLPAEAAEALLQLATGGQPIMVEPSRPTVQYSIRPVSSQADAQFNALSSPFDHPAAQGRFRVIHSVEELERALAFPWDKWIVFLHPEQRQWMEKDYGGPAKVSGSAGTGKTIVALHRAVYLTRTRPDARVLLTTFSDTLAGALHDKVRRLIHSEPHLAERLEVHAINDIGRRLYEARFGWADLASREIVRKLLEEASAETEGSKFSFRFLMTEWEEVVDAWQLDTWEAYRNVRRLGRKTRLPEQQRVVLWSVFERVRARLRERGSITLAGLFTRLAADIAGRQHPPFDFTVVDEAQDVSVPQLRFLAALGGGRLNGLFFAGDLGQRIFQQPFSWKSVGVDIRGRSRTLHINYRTSHQIRMQADRLLSPEMSDVDGNTEKREGTISVFNGPVPAIKVFGSPEEEIAVVAAWLRDLGKEGIVVQEVGVFVRSGAEMDRARRAVEAAGYPFVVLDDHAETTSGRVSIGTMHLAKGLEFRAVAVMACNDEVIPLQERIETVADEADLEEVYSTERHLLYVACTRARDRLLVTGVEPASEFLDDLRR
ncbi:MAG: UvrD-helicase domain-containing protein [Deltaproteobacteria bacterium]|nr:UvrD-helicase domain-containing protein [Deltaproteobacteria bacterium]